MPMDWSLAQDYAAREEMPVIEAGLSDERM
jgi:hypothetical protein